MSDVTNSSANGSSNNLQETKSTMLRRVFQLIESELFAGNLRDKKVVDFHHPHELRKLLPLEVPSEGNDEERLIELCRSVVQYSVRTNHPFFFNQLFGAPDKTALAGAVLSECMNASSYTFEVAPVFTMMEDVIFRYMRRLIGWSTGDGIFCPGGSISNMYAVSLARHQRFPEAKTRGMQGVPTLRIYTSEHSHYSIKKAAFFMGFGTDNLVTIPCDNQGRMRTEALEAAMEADKAAGLVPFLVNGTAGTTVVGAFDPFREIADVCRRQKAWFHVDGCLGACALLSPKLRGKLAGVELADSLAWNPHKGMGIPLQCAAFFTRHVGLMPEAHCAGASYLFQQDKFYDTSFDTGDKSIQCGRKTDIMKLWLGWQALGEKGYASYVEHRFHLAQVLGERVRQREGFELVFEPSCINVCFWFVPSSLRDRERTKEWWDQLHKVAPLIKEAMVQQGCMMIGYQPLLNKVNFFRLVTTQEDNTPEDMDKVLDMIDAIGKEVVI